MAHILNIYEEESKHRRYVYVFAWLVILCGIWVSQPIPTLPTPSAIYTAFLRLVKTQGSDNLLYNVYVTLSLQLWSLFYATIISLIFAYTSRLKFIAPFNFFVQILRYIPIVGFTLLFYAFFDIGFNMKVAMLTVGLTFFLTTSMTSYLDSIPKLNYELARTLGYSNWQIFTSVVFRPSWPMMLEALRQNAAMGWLMTVSVETFNRTQGGMGAMIQIYSGSNQIPEVYVYLIIIGVISFIQDQITLRSQGFIAPYTLIKERG